MLATAPTAAAAAAASLSVLSSDESGMRRGPPNRRELRTTGTQANRTGLAETGPMIMTATLQRKLTVRMVRRLRKAFQQLRATLPGKIAVRDGVCRQARDQSSFTMKTSDRGVPSTPQPNCLSQSDVKMKNLPSMETSPRGWV